VAPLKKNEKNPPFSFMMFINRLEGSCGTFGEKNKYSLLSMTLGQFAREFVFKNLKEKQ
jgi:hypothetical protein